MNPTTKLQENVGDWRIQGVETDWRVRATDAVSVFASYTWRDPRIVRYAADPTLVGHRIPAVSDHLLTAGVEGRTPFKVSGGVQTSYASAFYGNEQNSFRLPERMLWDAWLGYDITKNVRASVFVKNIFDKEYYTAVFNGVKIGSAFEGPPRTIGLSVRAQF
jgi:outer membrane receptor protein involved in Fe transport